MPEPRKGEKQQKYVSRYMGSGEAKQSFPDWRQRAAVAYSIYRSRKGARNGR